MKKFVLLFVLVLCITSVQADNLFQYTNPFPKTTIQTMNNIYESEPAVMQQETKKAKKSWFRKGENLIQEEKAQKSEQYKIPVYPAQYDSAQGNGKFYMFTTEQ